MAQEKNFENKIKDYLKKCGVYPLGTPKDKMNVKPVGYYEKRWGGGRYIKAGLPDLHIVIRGISLEVEVKAQDGIESDLQIQKREQIVESGALAYVAYPSGWEKLKDIIDGLLIDKFNREEDVILK